MKKKIISYVKKTKYLNKIYNKYLLHMKKKNYKKISRKYKVYDNIILFSSFWSQKYNCNPKGIYQELLNNKEYDNFKFIWVFNDTKKFSFMNKNKNTKIVKLYSDEYYRYCASAKYWITNVSMPNWVEKKKNQIYINTWHGKPIKKLGCNLCYGKNLRKSLKETKKSYTKSGKKFDYIFSAAPYFTKRMATAYGLKENDQKVIEVGYPRNDFLFKYKKEDVMNMKKMLNIPINKKVVFYAPTWRNYEYNIKNHAYVHRHALDLTALSKSLGKDYVILYKTHNMEEKNVDRYTFKDSAINVDFIDDINDIYIISDLLISDYSGAIFDYAILSRPIVYYMWDKEQYLNESQGIDFDLDELPGPVVYEQKDLAKIIKYEIKNFKCNKKYKDFNKKYNCLDNRNCAKKFIKKYIISK